MSVKLLYVTAPDPECAERIASAAVGEQLAACANILPGVISLFRWDGSLCREQECILILKTTEVVAPALIERVRDLHPYDCPCIVELPVTGGHPDFLAWVAQAVQMENPTDA